MDEVKFSGTIERVEKDGFGIVRFDHAIGGCEYGFFTERTENLPRLGVGTAVIGTCREAGGDIQPVQWIGLPGSGRSEGEDRKPSFWF